MGKVPLIDQGGLPDDAQVLHRQQGDLALAQLIHAGGAGQNDFVPRGRSAGGGGRKFARHQSVSGALYSASAGGSAEKDHFCYKKITFADE